MEVITEKILQVDMEKLLPAELCAITSGWQV